VLTQYIYNSCLILEGCLWFLRAPFSSSLRHAISANRLLRASVISGDFERPFAVNATNRRLRGPTSKTDHSVRYVTPVIRVWAPRDERNEALCPTVSQAGREIFTKLECCWLIGAFMSLSVTGQTVGQGIMGGIFYPANYGTENFFCVY
jgi:hypothetical protein